MKISFAKRKNIAPEAKIQSLGKASRKTMGGFVEIFPDRNWGKFVEE